MKCPKCQTENPDGAKFCMVCAQSLDIQAPTPKKKCPKCQTENPGEARFCIACAQPLTPANRWHRLITLGASFGALPVIYAVAFGIVLWLTHPYTCPPQIIPEAQINAVYFNNKEITDFQQVIQVPGLISIKGDSIDVPSSWSVWLCVFSEEAQRYYPQQEPLPNHGEWQCKNIGIGTEDESQFGENFFICLVVADSEGNNKLIENANANIFIGLKELPERSVVCDQIEVIRAKE